ncbi:hypothetical protein P7C73_g3645, partial [Tremellales sp. Uapishka_1]
MKVRQNHTSAPPPLTLAGPPYQLLSSPPPETPPKTSLYKRRKAHSSVTLPLPTLSLYARPNSVLLDSKTGRPGCPSSPDLTDSDAESTWSSLSSIETLNGIPPRDWRLPGPFPEVDIKAVQAEWRRAAEDLDPLPQACLLGAECIAITEPLFGLTSEVLSSVIRPSTKKRYVWEDVRSTRAVPTRAQYPFEWKSQTPALSPRGQDQRLPPPPPRSAQHRPLPPLPSSVQRTSSLPHPEYRKSPIHLFAITY